MNIRVILSLLFLLCCFFPINLMAEDEEELVCVAPKVKVCFTDGKVITCQCKERSLQMTDTPENPSDCVDEDDEGTCG